MPIKKNDTIMLDKIKIPPIVGVPDFSKMCLSGPSGLMGCPTGCRVDKKLIIISPKISEKKSDVKIAAPVLKVI